MKQVKPSKLLVERTETVVKAINPQSVENDNATALAYVLELPSKNAVDSDEYGKVLADVVTAIRDDVPIDIDNFYTHITEKVVVKTARVLSPEVRKARYEKAQAKLREKYGIVEG